MQSVLAEITKLRNGAPIMIDYHNSNRHRLLLKEIDASKTAYYFSAPIYNQQTRKLVDMKFNSNGSYAYAIGSNANIKITHNVLMENAEGSCTIELSGKPTSVSQREIRFGNNVLYPTTNGIAIKCYAKSNTSISFIVNVGQPFLNVWANDKCFALMKERFRPFVVFSCMGSLDANNNVIAPAKMEYYKLTDRQYRITVSTKSPLTQYILIESNLYENKLFQDTTVESLNPTSNNAFGSAGFIGNTSVYGEQWLYSKIDYSKLSDIIDRRVQKAVLHIPKLNRSNVELSAFKVSTRFCSFGSNWRNKIPGGAVVSDSSVNSGYQSLDVTSLLVDQRTKTIKRSEGLILKPRVTGNGFSVISTGDCYYAPQIIEVNFR